MRLFPSKESGALSLRAPLLSDSLDALIARLNTVANGPSVSLLVPPALSAFGAGEPFTIKLYFPEETLDRLELFARISFNQFLGHSGFLSATYGLPTSAALCYEAYNAQELSGGLPQLSELLYARPAIVAVRRA